MADKEEISDWLREEWRKRGLPPTGPTLRPPADLSPLYEELSDCIGPAEPGEKDGENMDA